MTKKRTFKVGDKVLYKMANEPLRVATIEFFESEDSVFDYAINSPTYNGYTTSIHESEILRRISDKPLCPYGKLVGGSTTLP